MVWPFGSAKQQPSGVAIRGLRHQSSPSAGTRPDFKLDPRLVAFVQSLPPIRTEDESKIKEAAVSSFIAHVSALQQKVRDARQQCGELQQALENRDRKAEYDAREVQAKHAQHNLKLQEDAKRDRAILQSHGALLSRDDEVYQAAMFSTANLPHKTDPQLKESFSEIENLINDISGVSWKADQSICPEKVLQRHSAKHSIRRVKKAILQDIIWSALHRFVFASPFRVFGELGKELELQWVAHSVESSSKDSQRHLKQYEAARTGISFLPDAGSYKWPTPSLATERWRYMTLQERREVLKQPVPSQFDPRAGLKKGFSDTIASLGSELTAAIQSLASVDGQTVDNISKLSRKVPKAWLDFCMHRARIVVEMSGHEYSGASQKFIQIGRGEVVLTVVPTLGRYGNNEGADLDRFNILKDGEPLTLP
ncbi:hypothetical protein CBER1_05918 [Cercospora berteroae]|uniref:Uncharacterized protein n=1 Tax=Cercospora berteroae TaxID=357750 RepID=A0A2S6BSA1_9PEZI|nr:hypothetical protein CBER1_05918 [Cercospora berteroae]